MASKLQCVPGRVPVGGAWYVLRWNLREMPADAAHGARTLLLLVAFGTPLSSSRHSLWGALAWLGTPRRLPRILRVWFRTMTFVRPSLDCTVALFKPMHGHACGTVPEFSARGPDWNPWLRHWFQERLLHHLDPVASPRQAPLCVVAPRPGFHVQYVRIHAVLFGGIVSWKTRVPWTES